MMKVDCDCAVRSYHCSGQYLFPQWSTVGLFSCFCAFWLWTSMFQEFHFHHPCGCFLHKNNKWCHFISPPHHLKKTSSNQSKYLHLKWLHHDANDNTLCFCIYHDEQQPFPPKLNVFKFQHSVEEKKKNKEKITHSSRIIELFRPVLCSWFKTPLNKGTQIYNAIHYIIKHWITG